MTNSILELTCKCGKVHGHINNVQEKSVSRAVCYCDYCRGFLRYLKREDVLDEFGGTDVFNISPRSIVIERGEDAIKCVRLSSKGALRFFAGCCNTPLFNTMPNLNLPFIGVNPVCVKELVDIEKRDAVLGPIRARVFGDKASYRHLSKSSPLSTYLLMARLGVLFSVWLARGDAKKSPVRKANGSPIVAPERVHLADVI